MFEGYKTVVFFVLVLLIEAANLLGFGDFHLGADQQEIIGVVVPLIGLVLRYITTKPVFFK